MTLKDHHLKIQTTVSTEVKWWTTAGLEEIVIEVDILPSHNADRLPQERRKKLHHLLQEQAIDHHTIQHSTMGEQTHIIMDSQICTLLEAILILTTQVQRTQINILLGRIVQKPLLVVTVIRVGLELIRDSLIL